MLRRAILKARCYAEKPGGNAYFSNAWGRLFARGRSRAWRGCAAARPPAGVAGVQPAAAAAPSTGKLIWMSAAEKLSPANQSRVASSDSRKSSCWSICGCTMPPSAFVGNRPGDRPDQEGDIVRSRVKISFSSSGGIIRAFGKMHVVAVEQPVWRAPCASASRPALIGLRPGSP